MKEISVNLKLIGIIHSPYKTKNEAPRQGNNEIIDIEIYSKFEAGLKDIEGFSHLHIFYWLHQTKDYHLIVQTPWDSIPHGVFTTRSPRHPNPIGYQVVELVERSNNILRVRSLDAIDGTPVIDIKPYIKKIDKKASTIDGWSENKILNFKK